MLSLLMALACVPSSGNLDVTSTGNPNGNVDDTGDTGEGQIEPHEAAGSYEGELGWAIFDWDWWLCEMDIDIEVDDQGNFAGEGTCIYYGQYDEYDLEVSLDGVLDEDGEATGTIVFESWEYSNDWYLNEFEAELEGGYDDDELSFEFGEVADFGDYYGEAWMDGWVDVRR